MAARRATGLLACTALALPLLVAGCADGPDVPLGIPVDDRGDPLPTLSGTVVDEAIRPLEGAVVRFLGAEGVEATTDAEGDYEIRRPMARAQSILVTASKPGFVPLTQQVQVSGRLTAQLSFVLKADPVLVPRVDVLHEAGNLGCRIMGPGDPEGLDCSPCVMECDEVTAETRWPINPTPGLAGAVVEVHWEALTPASSDVHAVLRAPVAGGPAGHYGEVVAEASGPSPLRLELPEGAARGMPRWTAIYLVLFVEDQQAGMPIGVTQDQTFDAYATLFYVDPAPPGYHLK